jgi:tRNA (guanine-N7-)-methyltransferase
MACENSSDKPKERRVFSRRTGRPLNKTRAGALETLLPVLSVPREQLSECGDLDPVTLFDVPYSRYVMEIGFGGGEHLNGLLARDEDTAFIGAEPFVNGMASFCKALNPQHEKRVRVLMDDALLLANSLTDQSLDALYILNPDPWHKKKHHKRRIIRRETLDQYARILKPGGMLISATDVPYLAEWIIEETCTHPAFEWTANSSQDWLEPPENWIHTRYASKGAKGASRMHYLIFKKLAA